MSLWGSKRVYADAAAATPLSRKAKREMLRLLDLYGNPGALHAEAQAAKKELEAARKKIAKAIHAHPDEIIFVASGTEANNLAIAGVFKTGHALTIAIEHQSILEPLRHRGLDVTEVPVNADGTILPTAIAMALRPDTTFASIQLVNSEVGTVVPVREIAKELRRVKQKVYLHCDAAQAPLWVDIDVEKLGVDLMTIDGQKVLGPKGVGALYVRRGTPLEPILWGGKQEHGLRGGTENTPQVGSFAVALEEARANFKSTSTKVSAVRDYLWSEIKKVLPDTILNGPSLSQRVANNLNISVPGLNADMAVIAMDALGVAVSTRSACNIGDEEPSHVIKALGISPELAGTAIRITLLPDVSKADARKIVSALKEVAERYRTL